MIAISAKSRAALLDWAKRQCAAFKVLEPDFRALGVELDGALAAAVFYDQFRGSDCNVSVLIEDRRVVSRGTLRRVFQYPFVEVNLRRVSAAVNSRNVASRALIERLGFQCEGTRREVYANGADEALYGMLRSECRWLTLRERFEDPHTAGAF